VNVVFQVFPELRLALQVAGGLYLIYVASRLWRLRGPEMNGSAPAISRAAAFRLGLLTNVTNPKSALFFGSVFAASFPSAPTPLLQVSAVVMIVLNALLWHMLLAYLFSRPQVRAVYARTRTRANRIASGAMGLLGLGLLRASFREAHTSANNAVL
jgi:threonine efflux protein